MSITPRSCPILELPNQLFACNIVGRYVHGAERWRLCCASKRVRQALLEGLPRSPALCSERSVVGILMTMFECADEWLSDEENFGLTQREKTGDLDPFLLRIKVSVNERMQLGCMHTLERWISWNNVCVDRGGFYSPLGGCRMKRVRIGWWERGVRSRKVWDHRLNAYVKEFYAMEGFQVYIVT